MKKRVVFIMTDTTRKDMVGCYGNRKMITPNLDKLASEGIRYDNAYTCQPVCGPARSAIFTGLFPHSNGAVANSLPLGDNVKTVGQRLTDNGIHCGYIGKWHLDGGDYFGLGRCPEGWDEDYWYDMKCYLEELTDEERFASRQEQTSINPGIDETFTYAHRCSDRAIKFLEQYKDEEFFLTVSYDEPHGPFLCPPPYNTMYDGYHFADAPIYHDDLQNKPEIQKVWADNARKISMKPSNQPSQELALFLGCNSFADYEIGRVLDKIEEVVPDALVIFTSDHGDMLGAHQLNGKAAAAYKEIANIPFIVKGGKVGEVITAPTSHIDITPTILDYMGVPLPVILEGKSILPQIYDETVRVNEYVFAEFTRYEVDHDGFGGLQMMRTIIDENFKLNIYLLDTDEFYDLKNDPDELNNLINDEHFAEIRNKMHDKLLEQMNKTRDQHRGYQWARRPWRKDEFSASWDNDGATRQRENEEYEPRQLDYMTGLPMVSAVREKKKI